MSDPVSSVSELDNLFKSISAIVAVVGAFVSVFGAYITHRNHESKIQADFIVKERSEWRKFMRDWLLTITTVEIEKLSILDKRKIESDLISRINLNDDLDIEILDTLKNIFDCNNTNKMRERVLVSRLQVQIAALLKHDWERVKLDTSSILGIRCPKRKQKLRRIRLDVLAGYTKFNV